MSDAERQELATLKANRAQRNEWEERQELAALKAKRDKGESSPISDFWEGVAVSGMEMMYGVEDLFGQMDDSERATFEQAKKDMSDSGWTTAGKVTGELAQFAVPGGAIAKGLKGANKLKAAAQTVAGESVLAGTMAGARLPEDDETRLGNAATDAAFTAGGGYAGKVLAKTMRGANKTVDAQKLADEGVHLTPGQSADAGIIQTAERFMDYFPLSSRAGVKGRQESVETFNKHVLQKAAPAGTTITKIGREGGEQLKKSVEAGYSAAWKGVKMLNKGVRNRVSGRLNKARSRLGKKDKRVVDNVTNDLATVKTAKGVDDILRREIAAAGTKKHELASALQKTRRELRKIAPVKKQKELKAMDKNYPDYLTATDAIGRAKQTKGVFKPDQLMTSVGKVGKKKIQIGADAPLVDVAESGIETVGKSPGEPIPDSWRYIVKGSGTDLTDKAFRGMGDMLMGDTGFQKGAVKLLADPRVKALRAGPSALGLGAGAYLDEEFM